MKISGLTIFLSIILLSSIITSYYAIGFYNIIDKGVNNILPYDEYGNLDYTKTNDIHDGLLGIRVDTRLQMQLSTTTSLIVLILLILSIKVDRLKE